MLASVELARRIDAAEARLCAEAAQAVSLRRPEQRVLVEAVSGGLAVFAGSDSPLNKLAGLGFAAPLDESRLEAVERAFAERNARLQAEVSTLAEPAVRAALVGRGYALQGFENVLGRAITSADAEGASLQGVQITPLQPGELPAWTAAVITGFEHPDTEGVAGDPLPRATFSNA